MCSLHMSENSPNARGARPGHVPVGLDVPWRTPSPRAQEIIRAATSALIADPTELFETVDAAVLASQPRSTLADPELTEAIRTSNRSNLVHWATANLGAPGLPVLPNRAEETLGLARIIARRGIEDTSRVAYSAGQNAVWTVWMTTVFSVTDDPAELHEVLDISARSTFAFVEGMLELLRREIERERGQVLSAENLQRLSVITRLIDGGFSARLVRELRYAVDLYAQTAVVLTLPAGSERLLAWVEEVATTLSPRLRRRPLSVVVDAGTVWAWFPSDLLEERLDLVLGETLAARAPAQARAAVGPTLAGFDGFRALRDAQAAAEVAHEPVVTYAEVILATLVRGEPDRARAFISSRIGGLDREERELLRAYLAARGSPTRAAAATYSHRNTVIERIRRMEPRLGAPLRGGELELALALELDRFLGPGPPRRPTAPDRPGSDPPHPDDTRT